MKTKTILFVAIAAAAFASCSTQVKAIQSSPVIARNVQLDPIKADIKVNEDQKLVGEGSATYVFGIRVSDLENLHMVEGVNYSQDETWFLERGKRTARAIAAYNALQSCPESDVLVNPKYEITVHKSPLGLIYQIYTVRVSGYGATYENFRTERQLKLIGDRNKEYIVVEE